MSPDSSSISHQQSHTRPASANCKGPVSGPALVVFLPTSVTCFTCPPITERADRQSQWIWGKAFWAQVCVCHRPDQLTEGGGTAILICWGIDLRHLEATAIHVILGSKLVKILMIHLTPPHPLIESDTSLQRASHPNGGRQCQACWLEF
jgi:hypothetical protein